MLDFMDEERICQILRAYVEEWGRENVVVVLPSCFERFTQGTVGGVRLEFTTENLISLRVEYEHVRLSYDTQLTKAHEKICDGKCAA